MFASLGRDLRTLLIIGVTIAALSFAIGYVTERPVKAVEVQPTFLNTAHSSLRAQPSSRTWKAYGFEEALTLDETKVKWPMLLQVTATGHMYALDWNDFRVKKFSPDGALLGMFGDEKDTGPGAFLNPTALSVSPSGEVWVFDPVKKQITRFDSSGKLIKALELPTQVDRIAARQDMLLAMAAPGGRSLFEFYSLSGERIGWFGEVIENQPETGIALDGNIISDDEGKGFVYGGRYAGLLAGYGIDGKQRFLVETIDHLPLPKIMVGDRGIQIKPKTPLAVLSLSIADGKLYVLSGSSDAGTGAVRGQVMDVYDRGDGTYLFSLKLPVPSYEAIVRSDKLYSLGERGLTVWRYNQQAQ